MKKHLLFYFVFLQSIILYSQDKNYSEWYLQREDVDIFVKEIGNGKDTVIVVHGGFGANHDYMLDALEGLYDQFHFILYDQRGSLLSPTNEENLTFQKNVDDLLALTKALKLRKVKIFCHSMGTLIGMEFAKQHQDLISHLVLAAAILPKSDSTKTVFSDRYENQINYLMTRTEVQELVDQYKAKGVDSLSSIQDIESSQLTHKELTEYWRLRFAAVNIYDMSKRNLLKGGRAYYNHVAAVMAETVNWNYDYRDVLNSEMKTTIINGEYDFLDFKGETFTSLLQGYNNIELKIIPEAGHNSWIDSPTTFRIHLEAALSK